jgi:hypothetical protein
MAISKEQTLAYQSAYNSRNSGEAAARAKALEEQQKAAEQNTTETETTEEPSLGDTILENVNNAIANADEMTKQQAINTASDGFNNYQSVGRAQSAAYSTNDDTYNAAAFNAENKMTNRQTAFDAAVEAGAAQLEAKGEQNVANNLAEAQKLGVKAETQAQWANTISTLASILGGISK